MRYFYDCEFLEDGKTIELISIGIVAEDGREYYAVNSDMPVERIEKHRWLMANVVPSLPRRSEGNLANFNASAENTHPWPWVALSLDTRDVQVRPQWVIRNEVRDFLLAGEGEPELWAYYGAYDHVALAQLWGPMVAMPDGLPYWTNDIRQWQHQLGIPADQMPKQAEGEHNALADARHNRAMWEWLEQTAHGPDVAP